MPSNPKLLIHGTFVDITFRTQSGLPFHPTPMMKVILPSIFARAQALYHFTICHALMMSNHPHILGVIEDPADLPHFVEYFKRETSHASNRLNDMEGITVWAAGYSAPIVLDAEKAKRRIAYCYANPQKADLVDTIEDYPNFNTWQAFLKGGEEIKVKRIRRNTIPALPTRTLSLAEQRAQARKLEDEGIGEYTLKIEPNAWMKCFPELEGSDPEEINEDIIKLVREREAEYRKNRKGRPVMGAHALCLQSPKQEYRPKKKQNRPICMGSTKEIRVRFIAWFKEQVILMKSNPGLRLPGFFAPGGILLANIVPFFVPIG